MSKQPHRSTIYWFPVPYNDRDKYNTVLEMLEREGIKWRHASTYWKPTVAYEYVLCVPNTECILQWTDKPKDVSGDVFGHKKSTSTVEFVMGMASGDVLVAADLLLSMGEEGYPRVIREIKEALGYG